MNLRARCNGFALTTLLLLCPVAEAAIYAPGQSVPGVSGGDVFTWERGDFGSTYSGWDVFEAVLPPNDPSGGFVDGTPDISGQFGTPSSVTASPGAIQVGSGNIYSPFAPLNFTAAVNAGTAGGDNTRIVAQFRTGGAELDYGGILLSTDSLTPGNIAPSLMLETGRRSLGGFGGDQVDYLALWDFDSSQASYRLDFGSPTSSLSLQEFHLDTFTQSTPFVTPTLTAIPEPGSIALLGVCAGTVFLRRPRRRNRRHQDGSIAARIRGQKR